MILGSGVPCIEAINNYAATRHGMNYTVISHIEAYVGYTALICVLEENNISTAEGTAWDSTPYPALSSCCARHDATCCLVDNLSYKTGAIESSGTTGTKYVWPSQVTEGNTDHSVTSGAIAGQSRCWNCSDDER